jgi:hypothetical protein
LSAGIKANNDGSAAIQVGGTDYITISSTGAVAMPVSLTIAGQPAGGNYALQAYTSPATWDKPVGLKAVKVTVVGQGGAGASSPSATTTFLGGGGGGGGSAIDYIPAPSIPGPVVVTAGPGTNSFGAFCSATAGSGGSGTDSGSGGVGSGGQVNTRGSAGTFSVPGAFYTGGGGSSILGGGASSRNNSPTPGTIVPGFAGGDFGGGGGGSAKTSPTASISVGGTGGPGIVIVEEFY